MTQLRATVLGLGAIIALLWGHGCGEPPECSDTKGCPSGQSCQQSKCVASKVSDSGNKVEVTREAPPETTVKEDVEPQVETKAEQAPETSSPSGRTDGQPCNPNTSADDSDKCSGTLRCVEVGQTTPKNASPIPYGMCMKACQEGDSSCPSGHLCTQTRSLQDGKGTGVFVCMREVGRGGPCRNRSTCKKGMLCVRYGSNWRCEVDCDKDANACPQGTVCKAISSSNSRKICKQDSKAGDFCGSGFYCASGSTCVSSGQDPFPSRCLKNCKDDKSACDPKTESCRPLFSQGKEVGAACFRKASTGEECRQGKSCGDENDVCLSLNSAYSTCYKKCKEDKDCKEGQVCDTYSTQSTDKICRSTRHTNEFSLNRAKCAKGSRSISFGSGPAACLADCSEGTNQKPSLCGMLSPGIARGAFFLEKGFVATVGEYGLIAYSTSGGAFWKRIYAPSPKTFTDILAWNNGNTILVSGHDSTLFLQNFKSDKWETTPIKVPKDTVIHRLAASHDNKVILAVGTNGLIMRSTDMAQTWKTVALTPAVSDDLHAVAMGPGKDANKVVAMAVGANGTVLQSDDGGSTWKKLSTPEIKGKLFDVQLDHSPKAPEVNAVIVGEKGGAWTSKDNGKTWKTQASGVTTTLYAAQISSGVVMMVGEKGNLLKFESGKWQAINPPSNDDLYDIVRNKERLIATGALGVAHVSTDGGKTWTSPGKSLQLCIRITSGGNPSGGACLWMCDPKQEGRDCPNPMSRCAGFTINKNRVSGCVPPRSLSGTASRNNKCIPYDGAPTSMRCADGLTCRLFNGTYSCLKPCSETSKDCEKSETCILSRTFGASFCGTSVTQDKACDPHSSQFCGDGLRCNVNPYTRKAKCEPILLAKENELCILGGVKSCVQGLTCTGSTSTPFRRFCTRTCTPSNGRGCLQGWACLSTSGGRGVCIERCPNSEHKCSIPQLSCRKLSSTSTNVYCL